MNIRPVTCIAALAALLMLAPANAATLIYDSSNATRVTAIGDLDVNGTLYNVDFDVSGAYPTFGGDNLFWVGDSAGALGGAQAIRAVLNAASPVPSKVGSDGSNQGSITVVISVGPGGIFTSGASTTNSGFFPNTPWQAPSVTPNQGQLSAWSEAAVVPIPAAAWLFGSALGLLGWVRRRTA